MIFLFVFRCDEKGLTNEELESKEQNAFLQFLSFMRNPLSWVMDGATLVAIALSNGGGSAPDWQDFVGIVLLLFVNSTIGFYEERSAGSAVKALMESLAPKAKAKRNGEWNEIEASELVPGDVVSFRSGDIVPADCRLYDAIEVSCDQAALTGESLPSNKVVGDQCFSGSVCKSGEAEGVVISTCANTFFGKAATLVGADDTTGHLQKILGQIGSFCLVSIEFSYSYRRGLNNILVLLIGGIPIAMPTVLSVTLAVGAQQLAKYKAIVTRITAIEELAGVTILSGTLTTNKLTVDRSTIKPYNGHSADEVILYAAYASRTENQDAIDMSTISALGENGTAKGREGITLLDFKPFNPVDKRTEIAYMINESGKVMRATKGMTGKIIELCTRNKTEDVENQLEEDVEELARRGLRALAVAIEEIPSKPSMEALVGVKVKMVTGDQLEAYSLWG
ncbi:hypothetical protein BT69DRAFT_1308132 [Atractiella rhizophila]|nr:hypothetical protein BT69DRAFT_1308132 [Atractiella rhizophila]